MCITSTTSIVSEVWRVISIPGCPRHAVDILVPLDRQRRRLDVEGDDDPVRAASPVWSKMPSQISMVVDGGRLGWIWTVTSMLPWRPRPGRRRPTRPTGRPDPGRSGGGVEATKGASGGKSLRIMTSFSKPPVLPIEQGKVGRAGRRRTGPPPSASIHSTGGSLWMLPPDAAPGGRRRATALLQDGVGPGARLDVEPLGQGEGGCRRVDLAGPGEDAGWDRGSRCRRWPSQSSRSQVGRVPAFSIR